MDIIDTRLVRNQEQSLKLQSEFKDKLEEQLFVIDCNLIRRQLNNFQKTELALKAKPIPEAIVKRNESFGGKGGKGGRNLTPLGQST